MSTFKHSNSPDNTSPEPQIQVEARRAKEETKENTQIKQVFDKTEQIFRNGRMPEGWKTLKDLKADVSTS